ncbi:hypothetical protein [uncultured Tateyamaria sp.]|uniref:hypothetical protein n=1 Tax=uncultured Tateyamaria sp. TaxID=455651 RepID=UPI002636B1A2|nr:hypothetical protein [uncultured Tateyamaria sp.]
MLDPFWAALILTALAGASIPAGAALSLCRISRLSQMARTEARHGVVAFGAGALLAAIALVLIPEGVDRLAPMPALIWFAVGGGLFALIDRALKASGSNAAQFLAMMMDYLPEAMALGALAAADMTTAVLVAILMVLQNLPEGFNAMEEIRASSDRGVLMLMALFVAMVPLGPLAALGGIAAGPDAPLIGAVMMLASGGILYLMFQDIAPEVPLENAWLPPLGAVFGFLLGLAGHVLI